jgi:hypothetical protein
LTTPFCCGLYGVEKCRWIPSSVAVRGELSRRELAAVVRAQHPKLAPTLVLRGRLNVLDGIRHSSLGPKKNHPHIPIDVVDE